MITSMGNSQVKELSALMKKARERRKQNAFVVEGIRIAREVPQEELIKLYLSESLSKLRKSDDMDEQTRQWMCTIPEEKIEVLSDAVFKNVSDTVTPQGALAVAKCRNPKIEEWELPKKGCILVLENIQDPGNLGTILRTAEGAGVAGILMSRDTVDIYSPKVVRSTMGSIFRMPFFVSEQLEEDIQTLKGKGVRMYAAHLKGKNNYYDCSFDELVGFMIGNEGNGLTDKTAALADEYLRIPMEGQVESLNAAMAAGILMYEAKRQRR